MLDEKYRLGENIRKVRSSRKESQGALAKAIGVSKNSVSAWESGEKRPDKKHLANVAKRYGVSTDLLLYGNYPEIKLEYSLLQEFEDSGLLNLILDPFVSVQARENEVFSEALKKDLVFEWYKRGREHDLDSMWDRCLELYNTAFNDGIN